MGRVQVCLTKEPARALVHRLAARFRQASLLAALSQRRRVYTQATTTHGTGEVTQRVPDLFVTHMLHKAEGNDALRWESVRPHPLTRSVSHRPEVCQEWSHQTCRTQGRG